MNQIIASVGAFLDYPDYEGLYGIGDHIPWASPETGRSLIKKDMQDFKNRTKIPRGVGKTNVTVVGRETFRSMGSQPLPDRHMIVVSKTLDEAAVNEGKNLYDRVRVVRNIAQAIVAARHFPDCGDIFFIGGYKIWLMALPYITHAYITCVKPKTFDPGMTGLAGDFRMAPEMLQPSRFGDMMFQDLTPEEDMWGEIPVELVTRIYQRAE